jgi:hypothetical protein
MIGFSKGLTSWLIPPIPPIDGGCTGGCNGNTGGNIGNGIGRLGAGGIIGKGTRRLGVGVDMIVSIGSRSIIGILRIINLSLSMLIMVP